MAKCKYCDFQEDGDPGETWDCLVQDSVECSFNLTLALAGSCADYTTELTSFSLDAEIYRRAKGRWVLVIETYDDTSSPAINFDGKEAPNTHTVEIPIKYCPICGRALTD